MTGKPTPTQAEADAHARGEPVETHEWDGSPIQLSAHPPEDREALAKIAGDVAATPPSQSEQQPEQQSEQQPQKEERAAEAETGRASYRTRRMRAAEDEKEEK